MLVNIVLWKSNKCLNQSATFCARSKQLALETQTKLCSLRRMQLWLTTALIVITMVIIANSLACASKAAVSSFDFKFCNFLRAKKKQLSNLRKPTTKTTTICCLLGAQTNARIFYYVCCSSDFHYYYYFVYYARRNLKSELFINRSLQHSTQQKKNDFLKERATFPPQLRSWLAVWSRAPKASLHQNNFVHKTLAFGFLKHYLPSTISLRRGVMAKSVCLRVLAPNSRQIRKSFVWGVLLNNSISSNANECWKRGKFDKTKAMIVIIKIIFEQWKKACNNFQFCGTNRDALLQLQNNAKRHENWSRNSARVSIRLVWFAFVAKLMCFLV